jgi:tricorn protease
MNQTHIVFAFGDDLWSVPREGGDAKRLTSGSGVSSDPIFSPDGTQIAFTGLYEGNTDVYVMPAEGGIARRLTYHPGADQVVGWTPDGKNVLFRSNRASYSRFFRLFTVPVTGGFPSELPLPTAFHGCYSPDAARIAYVPLPPAFQIWKHYRGGRATPIWIADLATSHIEKIPRDNSNDFSPMWVGDRVYFLSDRNGPMSLFVYEPASGSVSHVLENDGLDIKSASAGPDGIVFEQFGELRLFDTRAQKARHVDVRIPADLASVRPRFEKVAKHIENAELSPSGARAVFEARGDILTVPAEKGDIRNLTNSSRVADRDPAWSPDGKWIACFSDESGEYQLQLHDPKGMGQVKKIALGDAPSFYYSPVWSPDSKKIAYTDRRMNLWYVDVTSGKNTKVDTDTYFGRSLDPSWSPDSRWVAYTKQLKSSLHAVFVYSLDKDNSHQISDGMSDARSASFDKSGKYLYFTASTDVGPTMGSGMSGIHRPVTCNVYVAVLREDLPSPLAPQSDEEKGGEAEHSTKDAKAADKTVRIDLDRISQRTLALPIPAANYVGLWTGKTGVLFVLEGPPPGPGSDQEGPPSGTLHRFDLDKRKSEKFAEEASRIRVSHDGEKLLFRQGENWFIVGAGQAPKPGDGKLNLDAMEVRIDPRAQWKQMYHEVWRIERDFLYDPHAHGLDLKEAEKRYEPYLDQLASRRALNYLFGEMLGNLTLGHVYVFDETPDQQGPRTGLLGADYRIDNGRYQFARVYNGENWNPELRAPLTQPGVNVKAGEYLLAVNGHELKSTENLYALFEGTVNKSVLLKVGAHVDGKGSREVTVVPTGNEAALRNLAWIEANRRKVDQATAGRVAYIYVPDTATAGYISFNRYFFAQTGKEAAIIDERYNAGGLVADYVIDSLRRSMIGYITTRGGDEVAVPGGCIPGPKVMLINESAGSGGDLMPYCFRQARLGTLIGKRTWGGLVGIDDYPNLTGGGSVTAPDAGFWFPPGKWDVENHGVDPDVEVEFDPQAVRAGHDPQLEKGIALVLSELKKHPLPKYKRPDFPDYFKAAKNHSSARDGGGR